MTGGEASRWAPMCLACFVAYWVVALACDTHGGLASQGLIGVATWAALGLGLWAAPRELRLPTLMLVLVATAAECIGSLLWGAYTYRYHNVPAYVPPGHGLFYLAALRLSLLPALRRRQDAIVYATLAGAGVLVLIGLWGPGRPDVVGALFWPLLLYATRRGRDPLLFAVTFALTMGLEYYGTALGAWRWATILPGTALPMGNPPAAVGAAYCVLDALARRLTRGVRRLAAR